MTKQQKTQYSELSDILEFAQEAQASLNELVYRVYQQMHNLETSNGSTEDEVYAMLLDA